MKFKIYGAYPWNYLNAQGEKIKNENSRLAFKKIKECVQNRINSIYPDGNTKVQFNRLRATAGSTVIDGIQNRIENADAVVFDITNFNPNVMFELGLALGLARSSGKQSIFIIMEGDTFDCSKIPSDLLGFFISFYTVKNGNVTFKDLNSLYMRLLSNFSDFIDIELEDND
jgi:hypothetical protein